MCVFSHQVMSDCSLVSCSPPGSSVYGISQVRILESGWHFLLQGIFLTQRSNPPLLRRQVYSLPLSHTGNLLLLLLLLLSCLSRVRLCATPWTAAHQAPLSMGFFRQECASGLPFPPPGDLPDPEVEPACPVHPALQVNSLPAEPLGEPFASLRLG